MTQPQEIARPSRTAVRSLAALALVSIAGLMPVLADTPGLQVTSPAAGAVLVAGQEVTVEWTGGDPSWSVDVWLGDVAAWTAVDLSADGVPNSGSVTVTIPTSLEFDGPCGRTYLFYIEEVAQQAWTYGPVFTVVCETAVALDIHPGSDPNSINPGSRGVIPVAILTTPEFDASTVDPASVAFGPDGAAAAHSALEDVDGDGDIDLLLHVSTPETGIACGDTSARLTGRTIGGQTIEGEDAIRTVGCR